MQPFVAADAGAFGPLLQSMPDPLKIQQEQIAFKVGLDAKKAEAEFRRAQVGAAAQKIQRQQQFQAAMQGYLANPTAQGLASLLGAFPEFSEEAKTAYGALDDAKQKSDLTQLGEVAALASGGDYAKAAERMRARVEADKAIGEEDPQDKMVLDMLESGDPVKQKQALGLITYGIGIAVGPEHAKSFLEVQGLSQEPDLLSVAPGSEVIDRRNPGGGAIYSSPYRPQTITGPDGATYQLVPKSSAGGSASVAPVLSGLPAPVVAGLLGNFDVEGGYGGAKGDGGTAAGIAQWRGKRQSNFQRVIGKPVDQATPEEQARFVTWELQNPKAAGMTEAQRDAILAAKTPSQAAALLDKYYFRSSGKHRQKRMSAAERHANGGIKTVRSVQEAKALPKGTRFIDPNGVMRIR